MNKYQALLDRNKRNEILRLVHISLKNRYVYFAVPKCANSTVKYHLQLLEYTGSPYSVDADHIHDQSRTPLISPYQLPDDILEDVLSSDAYTRFIVVRHPVTRLLSCYLDRIQKAKNSTARKLVSGWLGVGVGSAISFDQFVRVICEHEDGELEQHFKLQSDIVAYPHIPITHVIHFERMEQELPELLKKLGAKRNTELDQNLSPSKTSAADRLAQYYTPELLDMIHDRYKPDLDAFGYTKLTLDKTPRLTEQEA
ncbi:MAG TPA: sulfotransferase family protein [Rhizomicrobium sp.]